MNGLSALTGGFAHNQPNRQHPVGMNHGLMPFGFPAMPNMNRLLNADGIDHGASFSSSSVSSYHFKFSSYKNLVEMIDL